MQSAACRHPANVHRTHRACIGNGLATGPSNLQPYTETGGSLSRLAISDQSIAGSFARPQPAIEWKESEPEDFLIFRRDRSKQSREIDRAPCRSPPRYWRLDLERCSNQNCCSSLPGPYNSKGG